MADVLDWHTAADQRALIERAVRAVARGQLVAFPTDTVYALAASALLPEAVERLIEAVPAAAGDGLTLAITCAGQARDWAPEMGSLGLRLARRCWPGPLTLVFAEGLENGLVGRLPEAVKQRLCPDGSIRLSVPGHDALWHALRMLPAPMVLVSLPGNGQPGTAQDALDACGERLDLILDDGPSRSTALPSVVRIDGPRWEMVREGAMSAAEVGQQTTCVIVFVCTGNTCRSPMAEALCVKLLAERLQCTAEELPQRGYLIASAGLAAGQGEPAATEAVNIVRELGGDLRDHGSRPLTADLVMQADHLLTMTQGHAAALASRFARQDPRPRLLCPDGIDVADPIGGDADVYRHCAQQILAHVERLLPELQQS